MNFETLFGWLPEVKKAATVAKSVSTVVTSVADDIEAAIDDPTKLLKLAKDLRSGVSAIMAAVESTPAAH